jgi:hypothetical protein
MYVETIVHHGSCVLLSFHRSAALTNGGRGRWGPSLAALCQIEWWRSPRTAEPSRFFAGLDVRFWCLKMGDTKGIAMENLSLMALWIGKWWRSINFVGQSRTCWPTFTWTLWISPHGNSEIWDQRITAITGSKGQRTRNIWGHAKQNSSCGFFRNEEENRKNLSQLSLGMSRNQRF